LEKYNWITSRESNAFYHTLISRAVFPNSIIEKLLPGFSFTPPEVLCDETTFAELTYYTKPLLLRDTDQTSMAHALEVRVPLLDYRLVDYMASVNQLYRYDSTWSYPKKILVDCFKDVLPEEVYKRKKQGFVLPMDSWIRNELKTYTKESLFDSPLSAYLNGSAVQQVWADFLNQKSYVKWSMIWSLAVLGRWLQKNEC
jgi:asparagine synthase (glutamine-hydrolysing)